MHLAGHPVDAEAIHAVGVHLELEDRLGDGDDLAERRARLDPVVEHHDPVGVVADLELGLREDHPVGLDAAELGLAELGAVGHHRPRQRHGDGLAGRDVGGAADDRPAALAGVDLADTQLVSVGMVLDREHSADDESIWRGRPDVGDAIDLDRVHGELLRHLFHGEVRIAVRPQPALGDLHRNCSRSRTSFSKNLRRSGTPYLSIAMRSIPMPNAKPWISFGS
jgi:hypothetical protein